MHIAIIAPDDLPIPPTRGGSVQIYTHSVYREFLKAFPSAKLTLISPGLAASDLRGHIPIAARGASYRKAALKQLRRLSPDVVQIENRPSLVRAVKRTVPQAKVILNLHSTTFLGPTHISRADARRALMSADCVVVNSFYLKRQIQRKFTLQRDHWHVKVIYPGVDKRQFAQPQSDAPASERFRILFVGRVIEQKGVLVVVRALRQLVRHGIPVHLTIVGRTPPWERPYLRLLRREARGLPVSFAGFVVPEKLPKYFRRADVLVCPSQRTEAFGMVNVEALAAGVPVVASRVGGIPEIVDESCGVLVRNYRQPASFVRALRTLAQDRQTLDELKAGTQKRAARFTWSRTAAQFQQLYQELGANE